MQNLKTFYENTILKNIDFQGYATNPENDFDKIQNVYKTFKAEFIHENNKHQNEIYLFSAWLQGLPSVLTVPFYNFDILENAKKAGFFTVMQQINNEKPQEINSSGKMLENQQNRFLNTYFDNLAIAFFTLKNNL